MIAPNCAWPQRFATTYFLYSPGRAPSRRDLHGRVGLLRLSYRNRTPRPGKQHLKPIRPAHESVNDTL
ncbi:hypothetical protein GCM10010116_60680 [Microbispora rosea subsp. aerata]|nr:hypothetical protein GCM10010116_60680 [Microbispora rosea subsp. aerata]GIH59099.1 hypothetical protein Mro02_60130 [Microbispora rosea subsp. aerata]GLJ85860.1 hypothetical protein GCM10017588_45930 [Microbispora rosea subsp. aerata]